MMGVLFEHDPVLGILLGLRRSLCASVIPPPTVRRKISFSSFPTVCSFPHGSTP